MRKNKRLLLTGVLSLLAFALWTFLIQCVDVQAAGVNGTEIGFATLNSWFHKLTGVHMPIYFITDWLGVVPIFICMIYAWVGLTQMIKRKSLFKVDADLILMGLYYVIVTFSYLFFEMIPINFRPILIDGFMEASYPSSTTLLVLSVMPTLKFQTERRCRNLAFRRVVNVFVVLFSAFMVIGRLVAGVHWCTDIIGSVLLSFGLLMVYQAAVGFAEQKH